MTLTWRSTPVARGPHGEWCEVAVCAEWPRLSRMVQTRGEGDGEVTTFHVQGLLNHWHSAEDALAAMRANP